MKASGPFGGSVSPESTVTSLLSKSGHLRSSLRPPRHGPAFTYGDKEYDSASAALDAYIADFERSCEVSGSSVTGKLLLPQTTPSTPCRHRVGTLRNKDVLRERLTDRELDFLDLPVSFLHHHANRDRLSMTTDELLSIPYDGSMPVTHTTALIQDFLSRSAAPQPRPSSSSRLLHHHSLPPGTARSFRCSDRPKATTFKPGVHIGRSQASEQAPPSSSLHLPRWFTSTKADLDCSGITSVPDLTYPAWLRGCDLSEPPPPQSELWDGHAGAPRTTAPSWVADLEDDEDAEHTPAQADSQQTLRDLRLQFAEHISLLTAERTSSDLVSMYQDNRIESLIQKADQVLSSLSQSSGPADPVSPVNCEELLQPSSSHRPLASAAGGPEELPDSGPQDWRHGNSRWKQPGPVEALKQMLFRLQAVEAELQRQQGAPAAFTPCGQLQTAAQQWPDDAELQSLPGRPSLERALHHLNRLKRLVEEPGEKSREEEKDDDEGRYSSSSADRLVCSRQETERQL